MRFVLVLVTVCALVVPALAQGGLPAPWKPLRSKGASLRIDLDGNGKPDLAALATVHGYLKIVRRAIGPVRSDFRKRA